MQRYYIPICEVQPRQRHFGRQTRRTHLLRSHSDPLNAASAALRHKDGGPQAKRTSFPPANHRDSTITVEYAPVSRHNVLRRSTGKAGRTANRSAWYRQRRSTRALPAGWRTRKAHQRPDGGWTPSASSIVLPFSLS
jgi:hypothetical protein